MIMPDSAYKSHIRRPIMQNLKNWLDSETGKKDIFIALFFYAVGVISHFLMGNFPKALEIYGDELLYFTIGQSIYNGTGIQCMNAVTNFKKVLYSALISPFFAIDDVILRIQMINLFNSILIMSSIIIVYLIAKELKFKRGGTILVLLIASVWPDLTYSMTFMAENFHWPFTLLFILLWIKSKKSEHIWRYSVLLGCLCYIGYLCKDIFLAVFICYIVFELCYPFLMFLINHKKDNIKLKNYYSKKILIGCVIFVVSFVICYFLGNGLLYAGEDSNAINAISNGLSNFTDVYTFMYLLYVFVYYIAAALTATLVMPAVYSVIKFKSLDKHLQMFVSFVLLCLAVSCAIIAYTISIREDIGRIIPRVHFRYIGTIILLLIIGFLRILQDKFNAQKGKKMGGLMAVIVVLTFVSLIFKGIISSATDHCTMNLYQTIADKIGAVSYNNSDLTLYPYVLVVFVVLIIIAIVIHCIYVHGFSKAASALFAVIMLATCIYNTCYDYNFFHFFCKVEEERIYSIKTINEWLEEMNGSRIMYLTEEPFGKGHKTVMTYFEPSEYLYTVTSDSVLSAANDGTVTVSDTQFFTSIFGYSYERIGGFDYVLVDETVQSVLQNVSLIEEVSDNYFKLYKNIDPAIIKMYPYNYWENFLEINFTGEVPNSYKYNISGMSYPDLDYTWTDGDCVHFEIPVYGDYDSLDIKIEIVGTFGEQPYEVVQNGEKIIEGSLDGVGEIVFNAQVIDNMLKFDVLCPGSLVVSQVWEVDDDRKVAFRFSKMTIEAHENQ